MFKKGAYLFIVFLAFAYVQGAVVDDFESYSSTADLSPGITGVDGITGLALETDPANVYQGSNSLKVDYDLSPGVHGFVDINFAAQDWRVGQYLSFMVKGDVSNSAEFYWVLTVDDEGQTVNYLNAGSSLLTNADGWNRIVVDLSTDPRFPTYFSSVAQLQINIQWGSGGSGTIYIDDIQIMDTTPAGPPPVIENFESYTATADLAPGIIGYDGVAGGLYLDNEPNKVYEGTQSLRVEYDLSAGVHGYIDMLFAAQDWRGGQYLSFMVKGLPSNSAEFYWVLTVDGEGQTVNYLNAASSLLTNAEGWNQVVVDLSADPRYPDYFSAVYQLQIIIQWGSGGSGTVWIDDIRMLADVGNVNSPLPVDGDLDDDGDVDNLDFSALALDWLENNVTGAVSQVGIENFESYATTSALLSSWEIDFFAPGSSTLQLIDVPADAYQGSKAMRWEYDVGGGGQWAEIELVLESELDLSQYDQMRLRIKKHTDNSMENLLYVKFLDNWSITGESWIERVDGSTYYPINEWDEWVVDLHNLTAWKNGYSELAELTSIDQIMFGCAGSSLEGGDGTGTIDFDEIVLIQRPCSAYPEGDINLDCKVNFTDFAIMAEKWLTGTN